MADDPEEVMRKHLRDQLVPPDHINTSLSAGVSEVIEVMMAKRKDERYHNADELLEDLQALREGQAPLRAHKRFDISELEGLEEGESIDIEDRAYRPDNVARYQVAIIVLSAIAVISLLGVVILLVNLLRS